MPFLTEQDYEMIPEGMRERLRKAEEDYDAGRKTTQQVQDVITKIYSHPDTKKAFEKMNKDYKLGLEIPTSPIDNYINPLHEEIKGLKEDRKKDYESETKKLVRQKFEDLSIPWTKEEADKIEAFRKSHAIEDSRDGYLSAIDLWAKDREPEPSSAEYTKPFSFKEAPNEDDAMLRAVTEVKQFKKSLSGRR
jgi:hypothetical protein